MLCDSTPLSEAALQGAADIMRGIWYNNYLAEGLWLWSAFQRQADTLLHASQVDPQRLLWWRGRPAMSAATSAALSRHVSCPLSGIATQAATMPQLFTQAVPSLSAHNSSTDSLVNRLITMSSDPMVGQDEGTQRMVQEAQQNFPEKNPDGEAAAGPSPRPPGGCLPRLGLVGSRLRCQLPPGCRPPAPPAMTAIWPNNSCTFLFLLKIPHSLPLRGSTVAS